MCGSLVAHMFPMYTHQSVSLSVCRLVPVYSALSELLAETAATEDDATSAVRDLLTERVKLWAGQTKLV